MVSSVSLTASVPAVSTVSLTASWVSLTAVLVPASLSETGESAGQNDGALFWRWWGVMHSATSPVVAGVLAWSADEVTPGLGLPETPWLGWPTPGVLPAAPVVWSPLHKG